jgi:anoctamin-1
MHFEDDDDEDYEVVSKSNMDVHIHMDSMAPTHDVADYPQNPYGQREVRNESLFFADGERSVDFVLAWKKLLPKDDGETQKELDAIKEKEDARLLRREVFEENLINEGLEIERETVDDEINFVKIHAPLEVLRRYAEILKLRLPMKEVSKK